MDYDTGYLYRYFKGRVFGFFTCPVPLPQQGPSLSVAVWKKYSKDYQMSGLIKTVSVLFECYYAAYSGFFLGGLEYRENLKPSRMFHHFKLLSLLKMQKD